MKYSPSSSFLSSYFWAHLFLFIPPSFYMTQKAFLEVCVYDKRKLPTKMFMQNASCVLVNCIRLISAISVKLTEQAFSNSWPLFIGYFFLDFCGSSVLGSTPRLAYQAGYWDTVLALTSAKKHPSKLKLLLIETGKGKDHSSYSSSDTSHVSKAVNGP